MNTHVMHDVLAQSQAGELIFPEVVRRLLDVGVESYFADMAKGKVIYFGRKGEFHIEEFPRPKE
jgi:uncharacterized protein YbcV (DUF1398 family)